MGAELSSIGASAPPSTPAPIVSTRSDSPRPSGSYLFWDPYRTSPPALVPPISEPSTRPNACSAAISGKSLIFQHNDSSKNHEPNGGCARLLGMRGRKASPGPGRDRTQGFRNSIGASAPPSTPAPIESTRSDSPRSSGSYPFKILRGATPPSRQAHRQGRAARCAGQPKSPAPCR